MSASGFTLTTSAGQKVTVEETSSTTYQNGTIVSGTAANKATEAALAAYPGGVVDRVVSVGNGEYNVHYIGVNWPHHVFVNADFTVVGAL